MKQSGVFGLLELFLSLVKILKTGDILPWLFWSEVSSHLRCWWLFLHPWGPRNSQTHSLGSVLQWDDQKYITLTKTTNRIKGLILTNKVQGHTDEVSIHKLGLSKSSSSHTANCQSSLKLKLTTSTQTALRQSSGRGSTCSPPSTVYLWNVQ